MNIDEVESGKGLRFLPSGHWTQDVVDKIKELNKEFFDEENPEEITVEYTEEVVRYAKKHGIKPIDGCYYLWLPPNNKHIKYGLSHWHYQQRRVRARRKKLQSKIDTLKKVYESCNPIITKINRGPVHRGTFVLTAIKDSQIHVVYI